MCEHLWLFLLFVILFCSQKTTRWICLLKNLKLIYKSCLKNMKAKKVFKYIFLLPVYFYKYAISPLLPHACIFYPTCSNYMIQAVQEFGIFKGFWLGIKRLCRCVPWQKKRGYDPVPINIKGDNLWIL